MKKANAKNYVFSITLPLALGAAAGFLTRGGMEQYSAYVQKPAFSPPDIVFPIAWSILYILMGYGAARVRAAGASPAQKQAMQLYYMQLFVNFCWSFLFFGLALYLFSFVWLLLLCALVFLMIRAFYPLDKPAALLQVPYMLWLLFAASLNFGVYILNR